jgi:hypothetical protein
MSIRNKFSVANEVELCEFESVPKNLLSLAQVIRCEMTGHLLEQRAFYPVKPFQSSHHNNDAIRNQGCLYWIVP